jgi:hypothetical protein
LPYPYDFKDETLPASQALCIRRATTLANLEAALDELFGEVDAYLRELDVEPAGPPFVCYHSTGPSLVDVEAGFPVDQPLPERLQIKTLRLEGGSAVSTMLSRPHEPLTFAEEALRGWLDKQCLDAVGPLIAVHLAWPPAGQTRKGRMKLIQRVEVAPLGVEGQQGP